MPLLWWFRKEIGIELNHIKPPFQLSHKLSASRKVGIGSKDLFCIQWDLQSAGLPILIGLIV